MDLGLKGRVAVVVGATQGIGRATAEVLGEEGCRLALVSRDRSEGDGDYAVVGKPGLHTVAEQLRDSTGAEAVAFPTDVLDTPSVIAMVDAVRTRFGHIDILVNTVGLVEVGTGAVDGDDVLWDRAYQSVLMSAVRTCRAVIPVMLAGGAGGAVVNTSAMSARHYHPPLAHYSAQKAAVAHFTKNLARQYGPHGVRVNAVLPGMVVNEQIAARHSEEREKSGESDLDFFKRKNDSYGGVTWANRFGQPRDLADAIAFLVSDRATYINGVWLNVDGGST